MNRRKTFEEGAPRVEITADLNETEIRLKEMISNLNKTTDKSRYLSLVITHLEIAEGFLLREKGK